MISIFNSVFTCICFEESINQLNLLYICIYIYICNKTRVMGRTSWAVDQIFLQVEFSTVSSE
jgi:hypothetical protein